MNREHDNTSMWLGASRQFQLFLFSHYLSQPDERFHLTVSLILHYSCWCNNNNNGAWNMFVAQSQWPLVLEERDTTFVLGTADIWVRQAPRIIHRERGGGEKACDRRIISASLPPWRPHAVWANRHLPPFLSLHLLHQSPNCLLMPDVSSSPSVEEEGGGFEGGGGGWGESGSSVAAAKCCSKSSPH